MSNQDTNQNHSPLLAEVRTELSQIIKVEIEHIWVEPVCEFFKISYRNATRTIQNDHFLQSEWTKKSSDLLFLDKRSRFLLTKKGFIRWIQLINPNTVAPELREKFIGFQTFVFYHIYGAAEHQRREAELFKSIAAKKEQRKRLADEIRRDQAALNHIYATKYGQLQLDMGANEN